MMSGTSEWVVVEQTRRIMATRMSIHVAVPPENAGTANAAIMRGMAWLDGLSDRLTRFSAESELAHLNAAAGRWRSARLSQPMHSRWAGERCFVGGHVCHRISRPKFG